MMQTVIIGLGSFGIRMLQELNSVDAEIIILDKDREVIEKYKSLARDAYITDAINQQALERIIPSDVDFVIVDLGGKLEASIMAVNYLHKMGIKKIIAKAQSDEHGELLELVGATKVVFPDLDAAERLTPLLASNVLFNYMHISETLALAEVGAIQDILGKTLIETNMRQKYGLNVVAIRPNREKDFEFICSSEFRFTSDNILLVAGSDESIKKYSGKDVIRAKKNEKKSFFSFFQKKQ